MPRRTTLPPPTGRRRRGERRQQSQPPLLQARAATWKSASLCCQCHRRPTHTTCAPLMDSASRRRHRRRAGRELQKKTHWNWLNNVPLLLRDQRSISRNEEEPLLLLLLDAVTVPVPPSLPSVMMLRWYLTTVCHGFSLLGSPPPADAMSLLPSIHWLSPGERSFLSCLARPKREGRKRKGEKESRMTLGLIFHPKHTCWPVRGVEAEKMKPSRVRLCTRKMSSVT